MITLTRLNGSRFALNEDHVERLEQTPDTVVVLENGTTFIVRESIDELMAKVVAAKAAILTAASATADDEVAAPTLRVVATIEDET